MTSKTIGPSFSSELQAAGLTGLPFSWGADGAFQFSSAMTADQIAAIEAVYVAHDPSKPAPIVAPTLAQLQTQLNTLSTQIAALEGA